MNRLVQAVLLLPVLTLTASSQNPKVADRLELVLQPRRGWAQSCAAGKLEIKLIAEKTLLRRDDGFNYRLEIHNCGREPVVFKESPPSFIKEGGICSSQYQFYAAPPGGKEFRLPCKRQATAASEKSALDLILRPGEYLLTRPARSFRRLQTSASFQELGTYRIRVVYAAGAHRVISNSVELEVVP